MKEVDKILGIDEFLHPEEKKELVSVSTSTPTAKPEEPELDPEFQKDFELARNSVIEALNQTKMAVELMTLISKDKEDAKDFNALNNLLRTQIESTNTLLDLHRRRKQHNQKKVVTEKNNQTQPTSPINVQNAIFTGTTQDLKKFIEDQQLQASEKDKEQD